MKTVRLVTVDKVRSRLTRQTLDPATLLQWGYAQLAPTTIQRRLSACATISIRQLEKYFSRVHMVHVYSTLLNEFLYVYYTLHCCLIIYCTTVY